MDEQTYMESYMAFNEKCFMVYQILRQASLTQNQETVTLQKLTNLDFL